MRWVSTMAAAFAVLAASGVACKRPSDAPPPPRAELSLPDALAGFVASPAVVGAGYVRRTYVRGPTRIDVTLARAVSPPGSFDGWITMSQTFPQATLDAPAADANGFYQCTEGLTPSCDLLVQMRSGFHLEIRGGGTSTRDDVDAIARGLPLRMLAVAPAGATGL